MARPIKQKIEFPLWKPQFSTRLKFGHSNQRVRYKALRNSSDGFISRDDVRGFILKKFNHKCSSCGAKENLQIDHINSIYQASLGRFEIEKLNSLENLTLLCIKCNAGKPV